MYEVRESKERRIMLITGYILCGLIFMGIGILGLLSNSDDVLWGIIFVAVGALTIMFSIPIIQCKRMEVYPGTKIEYCTGLHLKTIKFEDIKYYDILDKTRASCLNDISTIENTDTYLVLYNEKNHKILEVWTGVQGADHLLKDVRKFCKKRKR